MIVLVVKMVCSPLVARDDSELEEPAPSVALDVGRLGLAPLGFSELSGKCPVALPDL